MRPFFTHKREVIAAEAVVVGIHMLRASVSTEMHVAIIDQFAYLLQLDWGTYLSDGVHPNAADYALKAGCTASILSPILVTRCCFRSLGLTRVRDRPVKSGLVNSETQSVGSSWFAIENRGSVRCNARKSILLTKSTHGPLKARLAMACGISRFRPDD